MLSRPSLLLIGAGLSSLLTAWRYLELHPHGQVMVLEARDHMGGDHIWSFHERDIDPQLRAWIAPFIVHRWPDYTVRFPKYERILPIAYCSGHSQRLRAIIQPYIDEGRIILRLQSSVRQVFDNHVVLTGGETIAADKIYDGRGFTPHPDEIHAYQKFVGWHIRTDRPHNVSRPVIMDAMVAQHDGYRFVYSLPFTAHDILIEDTYYADTIELDKAVIYTRLEAYIADKAWGKFEIIREESGVLPLLLAGQRQYMPHQIGLAGGFYHTLTSYSLPHAVHMADRIAQAKFQLDMTGLQQQHARQQGFFRLLNRFLFRACVPDQRYKVLQRFYALPAPLIQRFYADKLSALDKLRMLLGKPPVSVTKALCHFSENAFIKREKGI